MKKWKVISQKYLHERKPWLTVREDKLEMPDGTVMDSYYVLEYPDWVNTIAITKQGKFVMIRQYRHAVTSILHELCAGVVDKDDPSPLHAAQRELLEETGYGNGTWTSFMTYNANPGTHTNTVHCFLATDIELLSTSQQLDEHEEIEVLLLDRNEVRALLDNNKIVQALHAAALWKYIATHS